MSSRARPNAVPFFDSRDRYLVRSVLGETTTAVAPRLVRSSAIAKKARRAVGFSLSSTVFQFDQEAPTKYFTSWEELLGRDREQVKDNRAFKTSRNSRKRPIHTPNSASCFEPGIPRYPDLTPRKEGAPRSLLYEPSPRSRSAPQPAVQQYLAPVLGTHPNPGALSRSVSRAKRFVVRIWNRGLGLVRIEGSKTSQIKNVSYSDSQPETLSQITVQHFLFAHGDAHESLESTKRVFDELLTDFITELCFEAHRSASLSGRQKIKLDDIKFACRKNPMYLGKIEETVHKKDEIDKARKLLDQNDDKITKSNVKELVEEPLGDADDDMDIDTRTAGGRSNGTGAGR
ncbi:putative transcription initiation factor TFIID subunit 13 [Diplocarpon rosae]|nr:putative transcription initiation factor TFIID subunit 13 [Diplocarpon rosae]